MTADDFKNDAARLSTKLRGVARRYLTADDDVDDTVQDAMLRLWTMHDRLETPPDGLATVLTRHLCIDRLRRQQHRADTATLDTVADTPLYATADDSSREQTDRLMRVVATLPDTQQLVLRMRHVNGMEMGDIAAAIGSSEQAIRKMLSRARQAVRDRYLAMAEGKASC